MNFKELHNGDLYRFKKLTSGGKAPIWNRRFSYYHRKSQTTSNKILSLYYRFRWKLIKEKHGIEISHSTSIGKGLYLGHPYNITINYNVVIGNNCNIHKGVTLGQENRGDRKGSPTIGNNVWIGVNATIVGKIKIGDDVLIAPNSFINFDVPDHSIVFGNPAIVKHCEHATEGYINSMADA